MRSEEVIVHSEFLVELIDHVQQFLVRLQLVSVHVDPLDVLGELDRAVHLHLLVGGGAGGGHLLGLGGVEGCLQLIIVEFVEYLEAVLEGGDGGVGVAGVHVREGASLPYVFLQQEVGLPVAHAGTHSLGIVGEVDNPVLHSLEISRFGVFLVEHAVLPGGPGGAAEAARALVGLELAAVVGVLEEEDHVFGDVDVDDDGGVVLDVELEVVEVLEGVAQFFDPCLQGGLDFVVLFLGLEGHVLHGLDLEGSHPGARVELKILQGLLLALVLVRFHGLGEELHPAVDALLHAVLLNLFQPPHFLLDPFLLLGHECLVAEQAVGVVRIEEVGLDLSAADGAIFLL